MLNRLVLLKFMVKKRIESVDCFAITNAGCRYLETEQGQPEKTFVATTDTLRPSKAGNLSVRHRLAADFAGLMLLRDYLRTNRSVYGYLKLTSERRCLQRSETTKGRFGKCPDGYLSREDFGPCVAIEVERSRRKSQDNEPLMSALRNFSCRADTSELHPACWFFVVTKETKSDILRHLRNEFSYDAEKFFQFSTKVAEAEFVFFDTSVCGGASLLNYPAWCRGCALAVVVELDVNGKFLDWFGMSRGLFPVVFDAVFSQNLEGLKDSFLSLARDPDQPFFNRV